MSDFHSLVVILAIFGTIFVSHEEKAGLIMACIFFVNFAFFMDLDKV